MMSSDRDGAKRNTRRTKTASIIPFPAARRAKLVRDVAAQMVRRSVGEADKHLVAQLNNQRRVLRRRGFADDMIEREMRALERAIRAAYWWAVIDAGEDAG